MIWPRQVAEKVDFGDGVLATLFYWSFGQVMLLLYILLINRVYSISADSVAGANAELVTRTSFHMLTLVPRHSVSHVHDDSAVNVQCKTMRSAFAWFNHTYLFTSSVCSPAFDLTRLRGSKSGN